MLWNGGQRISLWSVCTLWCWCSWSAITLFQGITHKRYGKTPSGNATVCCPVPMPRPACVVCRMSYACHALAVITSVCLTQPTHDLHNVKHSKCPGLLPGQTSLHLPECIWTYGIVHCGHNSLDVMTNCALNCGFVWFRHYLNSLIECLQLFQYTGLLLFIMTLDYSLYHQTFRISAADIPFNILYPLWRSMHLSSSVHSYERWNSYGSEALTWQQIGADKYSNLLGCYIMSTCKHLPSFRRTVLPPSCGPGRPVSR